MKTVQIQRFLHQDARLSLVLRPGMVFRPRLNLTAGGEGDGNHSILLCVANLDWAVLAWPLVARHDGKLQLDVNGQLEWHFVFRLDQWEAGVAEPLLDSEQIVIKETDFQPVAMCCLGCYSSDLVFRELVTLATFFEIKKPTSMSRNDLLRTIALSASDGHADFAESVVANEKKRQKRKQDIEEQGAQDEEFAEILLENMDKEDAVEFQKDMKIGNMNKMARKKKWQQMRQDGIDASWMNFTIDILSLKQVYAVHGSRSSLDAL